MAVGTTTFPFCAVPPRPHSYIISNYRIYLLNIFHLSTKFIIRLGAQLQTTGTDTPA